MLYYANFNYADDGITVTFPDIPEAITCGQTTAEALEMAEDVLLCAVEVYFDDNRPFPLARAAKEGETAVNLPDTVYAKVLLHNRLLESGWNKSKLAEAINTNAPEINRIFNVRRSTKIDTISRALSALGHPLHLSA